ncbi:MAG: hypothetical protein Q8K24_05860 [Hydrogenophaga sp.]|nr:hypothetical protein [Hydrogenophaga sp.]
MRTETIEVFKFDELSESAKDNARQWWRQASAGDMPWADESRQSIEAFCDHFGVTLKSWNVNPYESPDYSHNADNSHFRGRKLKEFNPDYMPTGYCLDCGLWSKFHSEFKRTGDAKHAFDAALWAGFIEWRDDMEHQLSNEYVDETIEANEYEFTEDGDIF